MFKPLVAALKAQLKKGELLLGIDENTALIGTLTGEWKVMGSGMVHLFTRQGKKTYQPDQAFSLNNNRPI